MSDPFVPPIYVDPLAQYGGHPVPQLNYLDAGQEMEAQRISLRYNMSLEAARAFLRNRAAHTVNGFPMYVPSDYEIPAPNQRSGKSAAPRRQVNGSPATDRPAGTIPEGLSGASSNLTVTSAWSGAGPLATNGIAPGAGSSRRPAPTTAHAKPARLARGPFQVLFLLGLLGWSLGDAPPLMQVPVIRDTWRSIAFASPIRPTGPGTYEIDTVLVAAVIASALLAVAAYTTVRRWPAVMLSIASVVAAALAWSLWPVVGSMREHVPTLVIYLVCAGMALRAAWLLRGTGTPTITRIGWTPSILLSLSLCVPWAIGRVLAGIPATAASDIEMKDLLRLPEMWWTVGLGAAALLAVTAGLKLIPPYRGRSIGGPVVVLVVTVTGAFAYLLPRALY